MTQLEDDAEACFSPRRNEVETKAGFDLIHRENWRISMTAAILRFLPRASETLVAELESLGSVAIFSGVGLLLSLSVLILDQHIPGDWF